MLMRDVIEAAKSRGDLIPAMPIAPWSGKRRVLLMCRPVSEALSLGRVDADEKARQRWAALEAIFSHFIEGGRIDGEFLKQLEPFKFEHWTIRQRKPRPAWRVFGRFAEPDVFVATHVVARIDLKGKWSLEYELEKLECEKHWKKVGLPPTPFTDNPEFRLESYVTFNAVPRVRIE